MQAAHHGLDNVTAIVDVNALQADGPTAGVLRTEPVTEKWQAFGWHALRVDGNDIDALVDAFDELRAAHGLARGADLRHPHRPRRAAARNTREGPLHARLRARVADRPRPARRRTRHRRADPMSTTTPRRRRAGGAEEAAHHLGDDRLVRRPRPEDHQRPVRARPGQVGRGAPGDRRAVGGPGQVHRHAHLPRRPPAAVLPDGHGRAGDARRRGRHGRGRARALRLHLLGVRHPAGLRLPVPRHRRAQPERQCRRGAARAHHRVRAQPPGHRGPGDPARLPQPHDRRPLRLGRHRAVRPAARRPCRADLPAAAARAGADRARRVRLPVRARQGRRAAHRPRRRAHLHRADDDAGAASRGPARGRPRRRRRAARAHDQAAGPRRDPARRADRPARRHPGEPHGGRRAFRGRRRDAGLRRGRDAGRAGRAARRVPRRRRTAHPARPLRAVHRLGRQPGQGRARQPRCPVRVDPAPPTV